MDYIGTEEAKKRSGLLLTAQVEGQQQRLDAVTATVQGTDLGRQQLAARLDGSFERLDPHGRQSTLEACWMSLKESP